ncbi:MAG: CoB--CoM heterodisulfide reductase iron-sulfur subunit A family protein [Thermodesulfobacteriota bacterium]|nr:CoB--CoM heterodisulfide reductase iron-sulfur subunit A family protein [Thermodesulfobacteriota bacterium]
MSKKDKDPEKLRVGVFICDCGSNIAGHLDCPEVTEYASTLPGVVFTKENLYTCSEAGISEIQKAIKENDLNRVVVASCSPRTHQPLFSSSCAQAGLNPYLFEMTNIRDQCSWVHMGQREKATKKAKDLVRMCVAKSASLEPQQEIETSLIRKVLVIGGGVAGLSAAEALASMGLDVILVDKKPEFGGLLRKVNRLSNGALAADRISELVEQVKAKSNITIHLDAEVKTVGGYIGNFDIAIKTKQNTVEDKVGCIIVATGALPLIPTDMFSYDGKQVITQIELEQKLKKGALDAQRIVMIQCVGARTQEREYCSRICCMTAVKNALLIKEQNPDADIHILYRDMQMYGTENEKMLWEARGNGIKFDVYRADQPPEVNKGKVRFNHSLLGENMDIPCDLVVLSTPLVSREDAGVVSQMLRVPMNQDGFFLEAHAKLRPLDFAADGIFVCGSARYPATVSEAMSQGIGVSSRVASILFKDKLITSAIVAQINPETCVGCMGCMDVCPFQAISFNQEKNICEINEILCKGCGNCAATCPSQSAMLKGFKPPQLLSMIRAA